MSEFEPDKSHEVDYPFVRCKATILNDEEPVRIDSWRPGTRFEVYGNFGERNFEADAIGTRILTIVSIHKPGKFPERIFYTQKWRSPDGKVFGKNALKVTTTGNFRLLLKGHRHGFEIDGKIYHGSIFRYGT